MCRLLHPIFLRIFSRSHIKLALATVFSIIFITSSCMRSMKYLPILDTNSFLVTQLIVHSYFSLPFQTSWSFASLLDGSPVCPNIRTYITDYIMCLLTRSICLCERGLKNSTNQRKTSDNKRHINGVLQGQGESLRSKKNLSKKCQNGN